MRGWRIMGQEYNDILDQVDTLENKCQAFENSNNMITLVSETFRIYGDSDFADYIYHKFYELQDQYDENCKILNQLYQSLRNYKELK
jgi:hypothetical protein